jgi:hypothetical protein
MTQKLNYSDLCVPIYLNQQVVFDLLAILEDGFSQLSSVKASSVGNESQKSSIGASLSGKVLDLVGISLKGDSMKETGSHEQVEVSKEKIHTPSSLFSKLRTKLNEQELITRLDNIEEIEQLKSGQFIELHAILKKSSLFDTIEGFKRLMEIVSLFSEKENTGERSRKGKKLEPQKDANQEIIPRQIDVMLRALTQSNSLELIGELTDLPEAKVVLNAELSYFNTKTTTEAIDGEFYVLGKIIRVIKAGSEDSINLLRNTSFRQIDLKLFNDWTGSFKGAEDAGLNFPEIVTEIKAPSIQILPIAIFT